MNTSSPTNIKPTTPLKVLIMGPPGSRKTTLALQFPDVHVLDCDSNLDGPIRTLMNGIESIKLPAIKPDLTFTYDTIRTDDKGQPVNIEDCFDRVCDKLKLFQTDNDYKQRKVILLDSLSHVDEFIIRKILKMKSKPSMEMQHWTDFSTFAYTLISSRLEQSNKTIVCTAHQEKKTEPSPTNMMVQQVIEINPLFHGKVGDNLGYYFTDVWRTELRPSSGGRIEQWLQTARTPKCEHLKNSLGMPPEINITEGFKTIQPYLQGKI